LPGGFIPALPATIHDPLRVATTPRREPLVSRFEALAGSSVRVGHDPLFVGGERHPALVCLAIDEPCDGMPFDGP